MSKYSASVFSMKLSTFMINKLIQCNLLTYIIFISLFCWYQYICHVQLEPKRKKNFVAYILKLISLLMKRGTLYLVYFRNNNVLTENKSFVYAKTQRAYK